MIVSDGNLSPAAYGDISPALSEQYYYARGGLELSDMFASYAAVYRSQVWIATLVNKIAYGTARLPLKVYKRMPDDSREPARDTPFAKLLRNPNPQHDPFFFWLWTVSTHEVYGEAVWIKVRPAPGRPPTQLWPVHPSNLLTYRNKQGTLMYRFTRGAANDALLEWPASEVVHFKSYNPQDQVRGLSRLEPLRQTILNEDASRRAAAAMWRNGGRPSMTVTHPKTLSDGALTRLQAQLAGLHQGVDNWGKIAILEEGMNPTLLPLNAEAMQYIQARHVNREEACGMYDVPPPVVHILDRATFSNITEQMRSMYRDTMAPRLKLYESALDAQLRTDFDPQGTYYAEFLLDEVLRGAFEQRAAATQSAIFSGQLTPNEARVMDNRPGLPGGDKLYINAGAIPLEESGVEVNPRKQVTKVEHDGMVPQCHSCAASPAVSAQGLCRSCAGKAGRMLTTQGVEDA